MKSKLKQRLNKVLLFSVFITAFEYGYIQLINTISTKFGSSIEPIRNYCYSFYLPSIVTFHQRVIHFSYIPVILFFIYFFLSFISKQFKKEITYTKLFLFSLIILLLLLYSHQYFHSLTSYELIHVFFHYLVYSLGAIFILYIDKISEITVFFLKKVHYLLEKNNFIRSIKNTLSFVLILLALGYAFSIKPTLEGDCKRNISFQCYLSRIFHADDIFYNFRDLEIRNQRLSKSLDAGFQNQNTGGIPKNIRTTTLKKQIGDLYLEVEYPVSSTFDLVEVKVEKLSEKDELLSNFIKSQFVETIDDIWINEEDQVVFIAEGNYQLYDHYLTIKKVGYEKVTTEYREYYQTKNKDYIYQRPLDIYEISRFVDYYPESNTLVFVTQSGDGCGGRNKVYTVNNNNKRSNEVGAYGVGCAGGDRFGGFYNGKIVGATIDETKEYVFSNLSNHRKITSLYLLDPLTLQKTVLPLSFDKLEYATLRNNLTYFSQHDKGYTNKIIFDIDTEEDSGNSKNNRQTMEYLVETNELVPFIWDGE